jgi:DNA processing protein
MTAPEFATPTPAERRARMILTTFDAPGHPALCAAVLERGPQTALDLLGKGAFTPRTVDVADRLRLATDALAGQLELASRAGARYVCPGDAEWPDGLNDLAEAEVRNGVGGMPVGLWLRGPLALAKRTDPGDAVAMIGSRAASDYGIYVAGEIAAGLADAGVRVVSGAAYGIDGAAHRGALAATGGETVAVLACGVDVAYPRSNDGLLGRIAADGLVVSESALGSTPTRRRFLIRNRLVAALTQATVIVEATTHSGTTSTAEWAVACSRAVLAVPGPVTSALSAGTHSWIRDFDAGLVTNADDVLRQVKPLGTVREPVRAPGPVVGRVKLSADAAVVLDAFPARADVAVAQLRAATGLDVGTVLARLGELDLAGFVERTPSGWRLSDRERAAIRTEAKARRDR